MEILAFSIFLCTVLYLVDKNHAWPKFWRFAKWAGVVALLVVIGVGVYGEYQSHHTKVTQDWFEANAPH